MASRLRIKYDPEKNKLYFLEFPNEYRGYSEFGTFNGIDVHSVSCPEWQPEHNNLYLPGRNELRDTLPITVRMKDLKRMLDCLTKWCVAYGVQFVVEGQDFKMGVI